MLPYVLALIYLLASLGLAYLGRNTQIGALGTFVLALLFSPLILFMVMMAFTRRPAR